jgi:hypothetical protein
MYFPLFTQNLAYSIAIFLYCQQKEKACRNNVAGLYPLSVCTPGFDHFQPDLPYPMVGAAK